ncbi:MAG: glycosyltransferase family 4 protein [Gammaproteobacteria bacterium]
MKILIVTDAWHPQVNGVVTTLSNINKELIKAGHQVDIVEPSLFKSIPLVGYSEIKIAIETNQLKKYILNETYDCIHISTEGPLGFKARILCRKHKKEFTTAIHTKFPEYLKARINFPIEITYSYLKWFHGGAINTLVNTISQKDELVQRGFNNLKTWGRAIDLDIFRPRSSPVDYDYLLYVGRVSHEKSIEDFLEIKSNLKKVVIGKGPQLSQLKKKYPDALFLGYKYKDDLAQWYSGASCFVFPSKSDTYGIVMIESLACGTPVAAYPVTGPIDVIQNNLNGYLSEDLEYAIQKAIKVTSNSCVSFAKKHSWKKVTNQFLETLTPQRNKKDIAA